MKKLLKIIGILAIAAGVLTAAAFIAFKIFFPPEKIRKLTVEYAAQALRREVTAEQLGIGLKGITLGNVAVSEAGTFANGYMIKAKQVRIWPELMPLLKGSIEFRSIYAQGLEINIVRTATGVYNFSDLTAKSTDAAATEPAKPSAEKKKTVFAIAGLELRDCSVNINDNVLNEKAGITLTALSARNVTTDAPFELETALTLQYNSPAYTVTLPLETTLKINMSEPDAAKTVYVKDLEIKNAEIGMKFSAKNYFNMKQFSLQVEDMAVGRKFTLRTGFTALSPYLPKPLETKLTAELNLPDADLNNAAADITDLQAKLGDIVITGTAQAKGLLAPVLDANLKVTAFKSDELRMFSTSVPAGLDLPEMTIKGHSKITRADMTSEPTTITAGPISLTLSGKCGWAKEIVYAYKISADAKLPQLDGAALAKLSTSVPAGFVLPPVKLAADLDASNGAFSLNRFRLESAPLSVNAAITAKQTGKDWNMSGTITSLSAELGSLSALLPQLKPYETAGKITADGKFSKQAKKTAYSGKIQLAGVKAKYNEFSMTELNGALSFSDTEYNVKQLTGKLNGSPFKTSLTLAMTPARTKAALDMELDSLVIPALHKDTKTADGKKAKPAAAADKKPQPPMDIKASIRVSRVTHPNFDGKNAEISADITGITSAMTAINGTAGFSIEQGHIKDLAPMASNPYARTLLLPLEILQKAGRIVKLNVLPNFDDITYTAIEGKYTFSNGFMRIAKSAMQSNAADMSASGSVNLPDGKLDMGITIKVAGAVGAATGPVKLNVTGTTAEPKTRVDVAQALKNPQVQKVLDKGLQEGKKLLEGLFK